MGAIRNLSFGVALAVCGLSVPAHGATGTSYRTANTAWVSNYVANVVTNTNPIFSNAVMNVALNIDTNSVAVLNEIAATYGGFPLTSGETTTTVGGILIALAAAVAWLKKHLSYTSGSTAADRVCATYTVPAEGLTVTIPMPYEDGKVADFVVYLDMTSLSGTAPSINYVYSDSSAPSLMPADGTAVTYTVGAINSIYFTQIGSTNNYAVACRPFKTVS